MSAMSVPIIPASPVDLASLPLRMRKLPLDARGYPVPWFVAWVEGVPEFRIMDVAKWVLAVKERRCWVCGESLGRWLAFPIGPMCAITRTTSEPPSHRECALWSLANCPFLSNPQMVRRSEHLPPEAERPAGLPIMRNPGVVCLWITREYETWPTEDQRRLITVGVPSEVTWWREGRRATRAEVQESIDTGMPALLETAKLQGPFAVEALAKQVGRLSVLLPPEAP